MFDFQNLEVYKKAKTFHLGCKNLILERNFDNYVNNQVGRASFSIALNIAEGSGKFSKADRRNFYVISRASLFECIAVLDILKDSDNITEDEFLGFAKQGDELSRILFAMIRNLK